MNDRSGIRACAILALALTIGFTVACSRKPGPALASAPAAGNTNSIRDLGLTFTPPLNWLAMDESVLADARANVEGKKQLGCFDASILTAFYGQEKEQLIVSRLTPNADYQLGQSALSQMARHAAIVKSYFAASGRVMLDKIDINGYAVFRITGKDESDFFSKYLFVNAADASARCFSIDVIEPVDAYSEATNQAIGKSVRSFRED